MELWSDWNRYTKTTQSKKKRNDNEKQLQEVAWKLSVSGEVICLVKAIYTTCNTQKDHVNSQRPQKKEQKLMQSLCSTIVHIHTQCIRLISFRNASDMKQPHTYIHKHTYTTTKHLLNGYGIRIRETGAIILAKAFYHPIENETCSQIYRYFRSNIAALLICSTSFFQSFA